MMVMSWISKLLCCKKRDQGAPVNPKRPVSVPADNPIKKPEDDVLRRSKAARYFAEQVLWLDVTEGAVVGVLGVWGSGKTSFVNLARSHWEELGITVLDFNPWMFSGAEQLVELFFVELSAQLKLRPGLEKVGKDLEKYGHAFSGLSWVPVVGPWIERVRVIASFLGKSLRRNNEGIEGRRDKVTQALHVIDKPIVVILDDIDRLTPSEIRDCFKLVRLTANFPNIIYVLAFDRKRVEAALDEQEIPGRDYLEKILLHSVDIPVVPEHLLTKQITKAIGNALSSVEDQGPFDQKIWPDVFWEIIRPLVKNMRDLRRYTIAVHAAVEELGASIAQVDVFALEAIRVFLPDTFLKIRKSVDVLTETSVTDYGGREVRQRCSDQINVLLGSADEHSGLLRALVQRLFPAGEQHIGGTHYGDEIENKWKSEKRVANKDILRFYLERVEGEELQSYNEAERALAYMANRKEFEKFLSLIDQERLEDVICSLAEHNSKFIPEHVVPGSIVILNLLPVLPERKTEIYDPGTRFFVERVVYQLLRSLKGHGKVEAAIQEILSQVATLSSKLALIEIVKYLQEKHSDLLSESATLSFAKNWRDEVRSTAPTVLSRETDLISILLRVQSDAGPEEHQINIPDSPCFTLALLRSANYEEQSQELGNRAISQYKRLHWDALLKLYGDENTLRERIQTLKASRPEDCGELLQLADKYLSGSRPNLYSHRDEST